MAKPFIPDLYQDPSLKKKKTLTPQEQLAQGAKVAPNASGTPYQKGQVVGATTYGAPPKISTQVALAPPSSTGMSIQSRQYSPQLQSLMDAYSKAVTAAPISAQDIVNSQEYKDLSSAIDMQGQQAQSALDRSFASRNMLRSTPMIQAASQSNAFYTAQKQSLIPQLLQAAQARQQQNLANLANQVGVAKSLEDSAFGQGVTEFQTTAPYTMQTTAQKQQGEQFDKNYALNEASVTGQYQPQAVAKLLQDVVNAKKSWANETDGTSKAQDEATANAARQALAGYGFSKEQVNNLVGSGVTLEQAQANLGKFAVPTMQAKQNEASLFGTYNGQPTLQGQAAQQQLALGELEVKRQKLQSEIDADPNIGTKAQKQQELDALDAQIASTYANIANTQSLINARNIEAAQPKVPKIDRTYIQQVYGVDPGLTTNYGLFNDQMAELMQGVNMGMSYTQFEQYLDDYGQELRSMGVDPGALLIIAQRMTNPLPENEAKKNYLLGEKSVK